jgi:hypothetical protein
MLLQTDRFGTYFNLFSTRWWVKLLTGKWAHRDC